MGLNDFLLVDFGTGVGSAAVVGGAVYRGPLALTGELGHTPVAGNIRPCGCGGVGCLETLVSREALARIIQRSDGGEPADRWNDFVKYVADSGLPAEAGVALDAAGLVIAGALNTLGLGEVIITGSLTEIPGAVERLGAAVRRGAMGARFGRVNLRAEARHRLAGMAAILLDRVLAPSSAENF